MFLDCSDGMVSRFTLDWFDAMKTEVVIGRGGSKWHDLSMVDHLRVGQYGTGTKIEIQINGTG